MASPAEISLKLMELQRRGVAYESMKGTVPVGMPVYVFGNGRSRAGMSLDDHLELSRDGLLILTNQAGVGVTLEGRTYLHVWDDGSFNAKMLSAPTAEMCLSIPFTNVCNADSWKGDHRQPFAYDFCAAGEAPGGVRVVPSCSGNSAIQVAHYLGSRDIRLVGFDYVYFSRTSNMYDDMLAGVEPQIVLGGFSTNKRLASWAHETVRIAHELLRLDGTLVRRTRWCGGLVMGLRSVGGDV